MLQHAKAAAELMQRRVAEKEAEQKRQRDEAEAVCRQYLTCTTEHPEIVEKLADAATLLGWPHYVLLNEGAFDEQLPRTFEELDTLEFQYREALEWQKQRKEHWSRQQVPAYSAEERTRNRDLYLASEAVRETAHAHEHRRQMLFEAKKTWRYPREIPQRYWMNLDQLLASDLPAAEMPVSELKRRIPLNLPDQPTLLSLAPEFDDAEGAARNRVIQQANEKYEADTKKAIEEHEAAFKAALQQREAQKRGGAAADRRANPDRHQAAERRAGSEHTKAGEHSKASERSEGAGRKPAADVGS